MKPQCLNVLQLKQCSSYQIKTIDKGRVIKKDGELDKKLREAANITLQIMFSEE